MDNAVFTFEQLLNQSLDVPEGEDLSKITNRCQERVIKVIAHPPGTEGLGSLSAGGGRST